jgi:mRNA interferase HicA
MKRRDFEKHLARYDCYVDREGGNHTIYTNINNGKSSAVPRHNEMKTAIVRRICRDLDIATPLAR